MKARAITSPPSNPSTPTDETWRCCARTRPERLSYGYTRIKKVIMTLLEKLPTRLLLSSLLLLLAAAVLNAAESAPQAVRIKIDSILASNQTGDFDARLKQIGRASCRERV